MLAALGNQKKRVCSRLGLAQNAIERSKATRCRVGVNEIGKLVKAVQWGRTLPQKRKTFPRFASKSLETVGVGNTEFSIHMGWGY